MLRQPTHCKRGHEFTPENTIIYKVKWKNCLTCRRQARELKKKKPLTPQEYLTLFINKSPGQGPDGDCWEWTGKIDQGYGRVQIANRAWGAHRAVYNYFVQELKDSSIFVCHRCDNPKCVNPDHLFLGTHIDNMRDMTTKARAFGQKKTACIHGHDYTEENTGYQKDTNCRYCITCYRERLKKRVR